jgi:hypothetical protein
MAIGCCYDCRQANAILVRCVRCARSFWMTVPNFICVECRQ